MNIKKVTITKMVNKMVETEEKVDTFKVNGILFDPCKRDNIGILDQFKSITIEDDEYHLVNSYEEYEALETIYNNVFDADFNECEFDGEFIEGYPIIVKFNKHIDAGDIVFNVNIYTKNNIKKLAELIGE